MKFSDANVLLLRIVLFKRCCGVTSLRLSITLFLPWKNISFLRKVINFVCSYDFFWFWRFEIRGSSFDGCSTSN